MPIFVLITMIRVVIISPLEMVANKHRCEDDGLLPLPIVSDECAAMVLMNCRVVAP